MTAEPVKLTLIGVLLVTACARRPPSAADRHTWRGITAGASHACAIRADNGRAVCWGENHAGEVSATPRVAFQSVSAGASFTCGIEQRTARLRCWGDRDDSDQPSVVRRTPREGRWRAVAANEFRACGLREGGTLHCWGTGDGRRELDPDLAWFNGVSFSSIWMGARMVCGLEADTGQARCDVFEDPDGSFVAIGEACGLRADGSLHCWGSDPVVDNAPESPLRSLGSSNDFTPCGIRADTGRAICWSHPRGWLDDPPPRSLDEIAVGWGFACGIETGGRSVVCWGDRIERYPSLAL